MREPGRIDEVEGSILMYAILAMMWGSVGGAKPIGERVLS